MYRILSFLLILLLFGCGAEKQRFSQVLSLKHMQQIPIEDVFSTQLLVPTSGSPIISLQAHFTANVDFSQIDSTAIKADDNSIHIIVPKPKLSPLLIDPTSIALAYASDRTLTLSAEQEKKLLINATKQVQTSIDTIQLISAAEQKTTFFLSEYLKSLGYTSINIRFQEPQSLPHEKKD